MNDKAFIKCVFIVVFVIEDVSMVLDVIISSFKVNMENFLLKPVINWSQGS